MTFITRRNFLKLSSAFIAGVYSLQSLPLIAGTKDYKPFKFSFLPDIHLSFSRYDDWILHNESYLIFQDTINQLNTMDIDFVLFGGDLIQNKDGQMGELPSFLDLIYQLNKPYYTILGNREADTASGYTKEDFTCEFRRFGFNIKNQTYWKHSPTNGIDIIGMDSTVYNKMYGFITDEQLNWLEKNLIHNPNNIKIILVHHPVFPFNKSNLFYTNPNYVIQNSEKLVSLIERFNNVDLVLSGHHHANFIQTKNNTHYINSPSIVTYPCEYRVIEFDRNKIKIKNYPIAFKQLINKSKESLLFSAYAKSFKLNKTKDILKLHKGENAFRNTVFSQ